MPTANSYIPKEGEKVDILIAGRYSYTAVVQSVHTQEFEPFAKVLTPNNVLHHVALNRLTAHQPDIFEAKADPPSEVPSAPSVPYDPSAPPTRSRTPIDTTEIDPAPSDPVPSPITHHPSLASCTLCGCTEMCACPGGCSWQEANLCTACHWALIRGRLAEKLTEDANYWSCQRDILTAEFRSGQSTIHNPQWNWPTSARSAPSTYATEPTESSKPSSKPPPSQSSTS